MKDLIIAMFLALLSTWLVISTVAFFDLVNLECIKYSDWKQSNSKKQTRECLLYRPLEPKENHE